MNNRHLLLTIIAVFLAFCPFRAESQENSAIDGKISVEENGAGIHADSEEIVVEPYERKIESVTFVPKGQWVTGLSVSYSQSNQNKYQFLVIEGLSGDTYKFNVAPMLLYIFKDDMGAGGKFGYQRSLVKLENADINLGGDFNFNVDHLYRLSHSFYGMAVFRNYFSIGRSRRFGFFNELQLRLGGGQSKIMTGLGETLSGSYETQFDLNVGIAPGLAVFLNNYSAIEVNVGVLGFSYTKVNSTKDRIYPSDYGQKNANFKINLFSITFGVALYL